MKEAPLSFAEAVDKYHALEMDRIRAPQFPAIFREALLQEDIPRRVELWDNALPTFADSPDGHAVLRQALSPYYLGFGNPSASILFVGQELAFNPVERPGLLFHENLNNLVYWREILARNLLEQPNLSHEMLPFSPLFPNAFHRVSLPGHTWGVYAKILAPIARTGQADFRRLLEESVDFHDSFFAHCFTTELHDVPARSHVASALSPERESLFSHAYFRHFPVTVIGSASLRKNPSVVERVFDVAHASELRPAGGRIPISVFSAPGRQLFVTWQLSGSNRPSSAFLSALSDAMKDSLPAPR